MPKRRLTKEQRRSNDVRLAMMDNERDALDRNVDRFGVTTQAFLRTVIVAIDAGKIAVSPKLFESQL